MVSAGASFKQASSQPPSDVNPSSRQWIVAGKRRLDGARQVFGGHSDISLSKVYEVLYLQETKEAIDTAGRMIEQGQSSQPGQSSQQGQGQSSSSSQPTLDWVAEALDADHHMRSHYEVNLMQTRFGELTPTMYNPARHTVIIAGRPVQATWDGNLVMRLQPCGDNYSFNRLVQFLFSPGALVALRVYLCPST